MLEYFMLFWGGYMSIEYRVTKCDNINNWFADLFNVIKMCCDCKECLFLLEKVRHYYDTNFNICIDEELSYDEINSQQRFFNYMKNKKCKFNFEYFKIGIEYASYNNKELDFISAFIRYIVMTNFDDVKVSTGFSTGVGNSFYSKAMCFLGDYPLGSVDLFLIESNVLFDYLKVKKHLRCLGVGTLLLKRIMKDLVEFYPNANLYANNVSKNNDTAISFYKKIGGVFDEGIGEYFYKVTFDKEKLKILSLE